MDIYYNFDAKQTCCEKHIFCSALYTFSLHRTHLLMHRTLLLFTGHFCFAPDTFAFHRTLLLCTGHFCFAPDTFAFHRTLLLCTSTFALHRKLMLSQRKKVLIEKIGRIIFTFYPIPPLNFLFYVGSIKQNKVGRG